MRGSRPIRLTSEGEVLLRLAIAIRGRLDAARSEIEALELGRHSFLRVGLHQSVRRSLVPAVLQRLHAEDADADIDLREVYSIRTLLDSLEQGQLDLVLAALPVRSGPFEVAPIYRDEHVLVVRADDALAWSPSVSIADLCKLSVIVVDECRTQRATEDALAAAGHPLRVTRRIEDTASILAFVSAGLGVGFIPRLAAPLPADLVAVQLPEVVPGRVIAAVRHAEREPHRWAARFIELAVEVSRPPADEQTLACAV